MSLRSLRGVARRSPVLIGAVALSATLTLAGCGDDVVDDGVEQEVEEGGEEVEQEGEQLEEDVEDEATEED